MTNFQTTVASIGKAFAILELFGPEAPHLRIADIARLTGFTRSAVQRLTHTLVQAGWLDRQSNGAGLALAHRVIQPAHCYLASNPVLATVMPMMVRLTEETRLSCDLWIIDGQDAVMVARVPSSLATMTIAPVGIRAKMADLHIQAHTVQARVIKGANGRPIAVLSLTGHLDGDAAHHHAQQLLDEATTRMDELQMSNTVRPADLEAHDLHMAPLADDPQDKLNIAAVARGLHLLQFFHPLSPALSLTELSRRSGFSVPMVQRMTDTFMTLGYIERDPVMRTFHMALRSLDLLYRFEMSNPLTRAMWPALLRLREQTGLRCSFCILDNTEIVHLIHIQSRPQERFRTAYPGRRLPAASTSGGRAILSQLPPDRQCQILEDSNLLPVTPFTVTDKKAVLAEIHAVRENGYAFTNQQSIRREVNVAAAIMVHGAPVGAIVVSAPTHNWDVKRLKEDVVPLLLAQTETWQ